jgi:divalent metal cation (Fe/Co/Zn/Cd) transporter
MAVPLTIAESPERSVIRRAKLGQWLTVAHALFEGFASLLVASSAASVALLSFGLDSMIEVLSASIVLWRLSSIGKTSRWVLSERAGLRIVGVCFFALSLDILQDSGHALYVKEVPHSSVLGILVALLSIGLMPFLAQAKRRWANEVGSASLKADARQTDFCVILAAIALAGLALNAALGWWWADPFAALCMVPVIAWEGVQALRGHACACCACSV